MSRYHDRGISPILDAAATWAERCLVLDGSIFGDGSLWTTENLAQLDRFFVRNLDEGDGSFYEKLDKQLAPAEPGARKLMAELLWVLYLFPSNLGARSKRDGILRVWHLSEDALDAEHPMLSDDVLAGIGSGGMAFLSGRWREINYAIGLFTAFKALPEAERTSYVRDYGRFAEWIAAQARQGNRQFRHMLRYLLFPDVVERMSSNGDRHKVLEAFGVAPSRATEDWTDRQIDEAMLALRQRLEGEHASKELDFYLPPLVQAWRPEEDAEPAPPPVPSGGVVREPKPEWGAGPTPPLNQILFGPPGTGKTYKAIDKALEILDPAFLRENAENRAALKMRFDVLAAAGLVQFVTFHQSFSYEDFVEGLRAESDGRSESLRYVVADGVFKQLCDAARSESSSAAAPRVLIIDEINRGNVSRIFGELITLIEPSKRAGAAEALTVTLPYSKTPFSVPANVHLIGTMNTADRSLAGLDIALRRRFQFVEMPPQPDLLSGVTIAGVNLGQLLEVMNHRIEALLDRDHQLGHAYFMGLASSGAIDGLAGVFRNQVIPLLQEYFFEDWERIAWVLNDQRKPGGCRFVVEQGVGGAALFGEGVVVDARAKRWRLDHAAFDKPESYRGIVASPDA
jgi:5-methylcytosine-specific restriction protein B